VMRRFVAGELDVLVSTTIIESGLDISRMRIRSSLTGRTGLGWQTFISYADGWAGSNKAYAYLKCCRRVDNDGGGTETVNAINSIHRWGRGLRLRCGTWRFAGREYPGDGAERAYFCDRVRSLLPAFEAGCGAAEGGEVKPRWRRCCGWTLW